MIYLIFDTETTGLPKNWKAPTSDVDNWPRLVQLSWVLTDGVEREEFNFIIKPNGFEIPTEASGIHGITTERAKQDGRNREFILDLFRSAVNIADVVVAHNLNFDQSIMGAEYFRTYKDNRFEQRLATKQTFCTMLQSTELLGITGNHAGKSKWPKLQELYYHFFGTDFDGAHDAINDTRACEACYFKIKELATPPKPQEPKSRADNLWDSIKSPVTPAGA